MAAFTDYARNQFLDVVRGQVLTPPNNWYAGLFLIYPTSAGGGTEPTGGGYARVPIGANFNAWNATQGGTGSASSGTSGLVSVAAPVIFPRVTVEWGEIIAAGLYDSLTGGNLWIFDAIAPFFATVGNRPSFNAQEFSFAFPAHDPQ